MAISQALENRKIFTDALFSRPNSLSSLLPYDEVLEQDRLFVLKDGSLGVVYRAKTLEHEALTSRQVIDAVDGLKPLFDLPENCTLQFIFGQSAIPRFDKEVVALEKGYPDAHPVSQILFDEKIKSLKAVL